MNRLLLRLLLCVALPLLAAGASRALAQEETYKFDIGAGAGMSGYLGDINQANMFKNPGFSAQLSFRYLIDTRWAIRGLFTTSALKGDSSQFTNKFPGLQNYSFSSQIYDLGVRGEFNFFAYGIGETFKRLKRWTPYIAVGAGVCMSSADGKNYVTATIPLAAGVKFKVAPRVNLMAEFCAAYAFGDRLDGALSDLQGIKSEFLKNTDWHTNIMVGISFEFGKRCSTCHYKD